MKKFTSVLLLSLCLISLLPVSSVFAAATTVYEEDFEDTEWGTNSIITTSELTGAQAEAVSGYTGNALAFSATTEGTSGTVKLTGKTFVGDLGLDTTKTYVYTQRIKFTGTPDDAFNMSFYDGSASDGYAFYAGVKDGKYVFASSGSANGMAAAKEIGEGWHTLVSKISYYAAEAKYDFSTTVYDSTNTAVWTRLVRGTGIANTGNYRKITYLFNNLSTTGSVLVDDATLYCFDEGATFLFDSTGSTADGAEIATDGTITLCFDQPVSAPAASMLQILDSAGSAVSGAAVSVEQTDFKKLSVRPSGLTAGQSYTLDFSGVTAVSGISLTGTTSLGFQTVAKKVYTEDFENIPTNGTFGNAANSTFSEIFFNGTGDAGAYVAATGYDGAASSALMLQNGSDSTADSFNFKPFHVFGLSDDTKLVFNMRFKVVGAASDSLAVPIRLCSGMSSDMFEIKGDAASNAYYVWQGTYYGGTKTPITADTWYDLSIVMSMTTTTGETTTTTLSANGYMYVSGSGELLKTTSISNVSTSTTIYGSITGGGFAEGAGVVFDDAKLYLVAAEDTLAFNADASSEENTEITTDGSLTLAFDQPITADKTMFKVLDSEGNEVSGAVKGVAVKDFSTAIVTVTGLASGATYTLDYSAVTSAGGAALAAEDKVLAFITKEKKILKEDFEAVPTNGDFSKLGSEVFNSSTGVDVFEAVEAGRTGKALRFDSVPYTNSTGEATFRQAYMFTPKFTADFGVGADRNLVFNISFMVTAQADTTTAFQTEIYFDGSNVSLYIMRDAGESEFYIKSGAQSSDIVTDRWYNVSIVICMTEDSKYQATTTIYDDVTNERLTWSMCTLQNDVNITIRAAAGQLSGDQTVAFDDAAIYLVDSTDTMSLVSQSESVDADGTVTLEFDQPVTPEADMFTIEGTEIQEIKVKDYKTAIVSFAWLDYLTEYTLDFSGVTSSGGAALAGTGHALTFTTGADPACTLTLAGEAVLSGVEANDTITLKLHSKEGVTPTLIAAFYEQCYPIRLEGVEIFTDKALTEGYNDVVLTLNKAHTDAKIIKLFAWDSRSNLKPLMREAELQFPYEAMSVLMIGNSLSEDAGRYFNAVAEASGLALDLTVKGVGGASLAHHAANLAAELAGSEKTGERTEYFTYYDGVRDLTASTDLLDALQVKQYDVISLQQYEAYADSDYEEALPYLVTEIRKLQPNAELVLYQTWAQYGSASTLSSMNSKFLNTIEPAVEKWAAKIGAEVENITVGGAPMRIIPAGYAFYLGHNTTDFCMDSPYVTTDTDAGAKEEAVGIELATGLMRDVDHASYYGCYLADAVWFEMLTGRQAAFADGDGKAVVLAPDGIDSAEHLSRLSELSDIAHRAVTAYNKR